MRNASDDRAPGSRSHEDQEVKRKGKVEEIKETYSSWTVADIWMAIHLPLGKSLIAMEVYWTSSSVGRIVPKLMIMLMPNHNDH